MTADLTEDSLYINDIFLDKMPLNLVTSANLEVFRYAKWDGIVGVGFTMESDSDHVGKSIIDRLINSDKCHDKVFIYTLTDKKSQISFC